MARKGKAGQAGATRKCNRLAQETSTYLKQHCLNPVDWYPWGAEALDRAKAEQKPILLSVGYAACHWCHVMEHESFEDEETAELMNRYFVNIKVDREERTDIDEIYMKAVQLMVGHGGWPMTVFLTPDGKPFFGGTYFPKEDRHGLPGFKRVLKNVWSAWEDNRSQVLESSQDLAKHLHLLEKIKGEEPGEKLDDIANHNTIHAALEKIVRIFDHTWGGFGSAPKFPHTFSLEIAMRSASKGSPIKASRKDECLEIIETTLNKMAYGGIHDQIGGGFARYSTDRQWLVPHFEKMLYDNALLARTYLDGFLLTGREYWLRVAEGILSFVNRELTTAEGAFYSSLDADSEGEEGKFYVWKPQEIIAALGADDGAWFNEVFGVTERGNFEHGTSILHLAKSPEELSRHFTRPVENIWRTVDECAAKLMAQREKRVRPGRDEKVLTSWNSLMISAFVDGYKVTGKEQYLESAIKATNFILKRMKQGDRLMRVWGRHEDGSPEGIVKLQGYLDDYAYFIDALVNLASVHEDPQWLTAADELCRSMLSHFRDSAEGGFYFTADDHEELVVRPRSHFDGSVPSGTSAATMALLKLATLTDNEEYRQVAREVFSIYGPHLTRMPDQFSNLLNALDFYLSSPEQIAVVLPEGRAATDSSTAPLVLALHDRYHPNKVMALAHESQNATMLFKDRSAAGDRANVYICRNFTCQAPISTISEIKQAVSDW